MYGRSTAAPQLAQSLTSRSEFALEHVGAQHAAPHLGKIQTLVALPLTTAPPNPRDSLLAPGFSYSSLSTFNYRLQLPLLHRYIITSLLLYFAFSASVPSAPSVVKSAFSPLGSHTIPGDNID